MTTTDKTCRICVITNFTSYQHMMKLLSIYFGHCSEDCWSRYCLWLKTTPDEDGFLPVIYGSPNYFKYKQRISITSVLTILNWLIIKNQTPMSLIPFLATQWNENEVKDFDNYWISNSFVNFDKVYG